MVFFLCMKQVKKSILQLDMSKANYCSNPFEVFLFYIQYFFSNYSPAPWEDNAKKYKCIMQVKDRVPPKDGAQTDTNEPVSF